ncbi:MAG: electron transfer flavoprotein subunit beta/FixA family protein [Bradymonadia bacterium]
MKILVTAKRVTDPDSKLTLSGGKLDVDNVDYKMNPFCEIAVEEALKILEEHDGDEVVAVAIGDEEATKELRTAMAMGAHRGILVEVEDELEELDSDATAQLLKAVVEKEEPDLVILGKQAVDGDSNQVAQLLAEYLGWPQATFAYKVTVEDGGAQVMREVDGGVETVHVSFPAVITTDLRLNEPRYASLPGIMKAKRKPLDEMDPDDLDVEMELKVEVVGYELPPERAAGIKVGSVDELVEKLANEAKVI